MKHTPGSARLLTVSISVLLIIWLLPVRGGVAASRVVTPTPGSPLASQGRRRPLPVPESHTFVNYRGEGVVGCRDASEEEAQALKRSAGRPLHAISEEGQGRGRALELQSAGFRIVLRATDQLEDYLAARAAFLNAAARWESLISTAITVVVDVDFGPTWFGERYDNQVLGQTDSQWLGDSGIYPEVRDSLIGLAIDDDGAGLFNLLPDASVPTDIGNTSYVLAPSALWRTLGFIAPVADPNAEESDLGDAPAVGFNSDFQYDFDPSDGIDSNSIDFDAVAVHEIGHVLGVDSNTGYRELAHNAPVAVSIWDLFRFRPGVTLDSFATAQRVLFSGGSQEFFDGDREVALSTGRPDGTGGDGEQSSHWKDDRLTGQYIGVMDPTLADGRRVTISENDLAALRSFGYATGINQILPDAPTITCLV